jgi:hypothetical protein
VKIDNNGGSNGGSSGLWHAGEGAASCGDACAAVRLCRVPCGVAAGAQHGHQQARLPRLPEHHRALPARAIRILPREVGGARALLFISTCDGSMNKY